MNESLNVALRLKGLKHLHVEKRGDHVLISNIQGRGEVINVLRRIQFVKCSIAKDKGADTFKMSVKGV